MVTGNEHKRFTACGDRDAEMLLERVLAEIAEKLSGTGLCVVLGGSYGRGDGGVRQDKENGILYNDLDFFVFARKSSAEGEGVLKEISQKYEHELKVDVDFSRTMNIDNIKSNAPRLMMQELKRGYHLVCGEDLLKKYLQEIPANALPFSEACRLLLNRGMGLLLAGEKIANSSSDTDFIMRNLYKAILGAGDAMLIASGQYRWKLAERLDLIGNSDIPELWKELYREGVEFKRSPHRRKKADMVTFWDNVRDFLLDSIKRCAGEEDFREGIFKNCCKNGEVSMENLLKYCIKSRSLPWGSWKYCTMPPVAVMLNDLVAALQSMPEAIDQKSKLYQHWLIFN